MSALSHWQTWSKHNVPNAGCSTLKSSSKDTEQTGSLDVTNAAKGIARPHNDERGHRSASAEEAICRGDDGRCYAGITRLFTLREVKIQVPTRQTDGRANDGRSITVCLLRDKISTRGFLFRRSRTSEPIAIKAKTSLP